MGKAKSDIKPERDEALYRAYKSAFKELIGQVPEEELFDAAVRKAIHTPQPRLWVSFWGVYDILRRIARGYRPKNEHERKHHSARNDLERDVERVYNRLIQHRAFRESDVYFITSFILSEPFPGFYISESYAKRVISGFRARKFKQRTER